MIIRIVLMPLYIVLIALRILLGFMTRLTDWIFYIIGGLLLIVTVLSYYFGLESGDGIKQMIIGSGVFFLIPQAATLLEGALEICSLRLGNFIGGH